MLMFCMHRSIVLNLSTPCRNDPYLSRLPVSVINSWYQREGYIKSMADLISKELDRFSVPAQVCLVNPSTNLEIYIFFFMQMNLLV